MVKVTKTNPQILKIVAKVLTKIIHRRRCNMERHSQKAERTNKKKCRSQHLCINRYTSPDEIVLVPGKVLGNGILEHKVNVAAMSFSKSAEEKISTAGGECMDILEVIEKYPKGSGIRIME